MVNSRHDEERAGDAHDPGEAAGPGFAVHELRACSARLTARRDYGNEKKKYW
jgi:hypothetical protein